MFKDASFHLLYIGESKLSHEIQDAVKKTFSFPVKIIEKNLTEPWKKLGVNNQLFVLVRPDNYMAFISDTFDERELKNHFKKYFN